MADKEEKVAKKAKDPKPNIFKRIGAWFKSLRSESKKISWASWSTVRKNTLIVLGVVLVFAVALGLVDYLLGGAVVGLSRII